MKILAYKYDADYHCIDCTIQKFKQLYDASCKLHKIGYYKNWPAEYYDDVVKTRQEDYEKLFKKYWEQEGERILNAAGQIH